jgi:plastocyanin
MFSSRSLALFSVVLAAWLCFALVPAVQAQTADVVAQIHLARGGETKGAQHLSLPPAVLWLSPLSLDPGALAQASKMHFRMAQRNKKFDPPFLVVPLGSTVDFPNRDPFFHNVFSQFNGKRFDLGLYETGSTKDVRFDHEGVSYIFCNIHPEMAAVIVTLATPYYAVSSDSGVVVIHNVPVGSYEMHVWAEGADAKQLEGLARRVSIGPSQNDLGSIQIATNGTLLAHKNKFGEDYRPEEKPTY